jgi:hypothetical protein
MPPPKPSRHQATTIPRQTPSGKNANNTNSRVVNCDKFNPSPKANSSTMPTARMLNTLADHRNAQSETDLFVIDPFTSSLPIGQVCDHHYTADGTARKAEKGVPHAPKSQIGHILSLLICVNPPQVLRQVLLGDRRRTLASFCRLDSTPNRPVMIPSTGRYHPKCTIHFPKTWQPDRMTWWPCTS